MRFTTHSSVPIYFFFIFLVVNTVSRGENKSSSERRHDVLKFMSRLHLVGLSTCSVSIHASDHSQKTGVN